MTRRVAVFTSSRADLGPLGPVLNALDAHSAIELVVIATGTHLTSAYGGRLEDIALGAESSLVVLDAALSGTTPSDLGESYGQIAAGVSRILAETAVDILVLLGDRWELLAAAGAALLHNVPIAHLHGGEITEGAIDERIRHSITKLADLHLCATEESARRIRYLGEESWRIVVTGAPGLDRIRDAIPASPDQLQALLGHVPLRRPFGVVVYHPTTVDRRDVARRARAVYDGSAEVLGSLLALYPGADPGSDIVIDELRAAAARHANMAVARNLGEVYLSVLKSADVLVGNSSSGIIEAASIALPVVDAGERQHGRLRPPNVLHVSEARADVRDGVRRAIDGAFRRSVETVSNPYGDGRASDRIVDALLATPLDRLARKPLVAVPELDGILGAMTVQRHSSLRDAMAAIDRGRSQIAFVVEDDGRLAGTVTDGDVRRALLAGASVGDELAPYVNTLPIVATLADSRQDVLEVMERNGVSQVPVVDERGTLVGVHLMRVIVGNALDAVTGAVNASGAMTAG